jgi:hypothetical protein
MSPPSLAFARRAYADVSHDYSPSAADTPAALCHNLAPRSDIPGGD